MSKKKKRQSFTVRDCLTIMGFLVIFFFFTIGNINETQQSTSENSHYQTVTIRQLWTSRSYCSSYGKMESTDGVVYNLPDDVYAVLCEKDAIGQTIHIYVYDKFPLPWGRLDPCVITAEIDGAVVGSVDAYNLDSALVRIITFSMGGFALLFAVLLIYINIQELPSVRKRQKVRSQIKRQKAMEKKARSMTQENGK